jgi:hypothetical protein
VVDRLACVVDGAGTAMVLDDGNVRVGEKWVLTVFNFDNFQNPAKIKYNPNAGIDLNLPTFSLKRWIALSLFF